MALPGTARFSRDTPREVIWAALMIKHIEDRLDVDRACAAVSVLSHIVDTWDELVAAHTAYWVAWGLGAWAREFE